MRYLLTLFILLFTISAYAETKDIVIKVPDTFTDKQCEFIKKSAMLQIEAEMKKELVIPQKDIDIVQVKVDEIKQAMGLEVKPIEKQINESQ